MTSDARVRVARLPSDPEEMRKAQDEINRGVRDVLDGGYGGIRVSEQFSRILETVIDTGRFPITVSNDALKGLAAPPLGLLLLRATVQRTTSGRNLSGGTVDWEWRDGALVLHAVSGLAATTRYNATLLVME